MSLKAKVFCLSGTWTSFGFGAGFDLRNNLTFYGSLERSNGSDYSEDYRYSVGARYAY
ncbi:MAG: autotransporter outer membrane beta-barrel domain-containing protein [Sutterella wadsworthensis]|nr:autotransporter outer membrane beta-barrel domain-containing protein [Sutterella wadsworthensis]